MRHRFTCLLPAATIRTLRAQCLETGSAFTVHTAAILGEALSRIERLKTDIDLVEAEIDLLSTDTAEVTLTLSVAMANHLAEVARGLEKKPTRLVRAAMVLGARRHASKVQGQDIPDRLTISVPPELADRFATVERVMAAELMRTLDSLAALDPTADNHPIDAMVRDSTAEKLRAGLTSKLAAYPETTLALDFTDPANVPRARLLGEAATILKMRPGDIVRGFALRMIEAADESGED